MPIPNAAIYISLLTMVLALFIVYAMITGNKLQKNQVEIGQSLQLIVKSLELERTVLHEAFDQTLSSWAAALEMRDLETRGHSARVTLLTVSLAKAMGVTNGDLINMQRGALLHDVGKMSIPDAILLKPGRLTDEERKVMETHPQIAYDNLSLIPFLYPALEIPYCHHERYDGSGYPRGLKDGQIPLSARIFSVIDVYDALTSDRPYRKAMSKLETIQYIRENSGTLFEPKVVDAFITMMEKRI